MHAVRYGQHVDAIDGAGFDTQITAGTFISDDRVHVARCAHNRIHWTGLNALGAANALRLADIRHAARRCAVFGVKGFGFNL